MVADGRAPPSASTMALAAPRTEVDALPYIDHHFNDDGMRKQVEALIDAELHTFKPAADALAHLPLREPDFANHPVLQAEWLRVCAEEPMPPMDVSRYQLDPPPRAKHADPAAWARCVENAQAQLEHQGTRLDNLELLQQHGANLWVAHLNTLDQATTRMIAEDEQLARTIEELNRSRKAQQVQIGPKLARLEAAWVESVKKNLSIERECMLLERECSDLRKRLDPTAQ